jgi:hypothetical protein
MSTTFSIERDPYALVAAISTSTWHCRLGHPDPNVLSQLSRYSVITCARASSESLCHACQLDHHIRLPFLSSSPRVVCAFDLIHCDLWTSPVPSVSRYKYYLVIADDCTHYSCSFPLRHKSNVFLTLSHFSAYVSTQFGCTIRSVQCNNGREFDNSSTHTFFLSHGVQLQMSCPYTSPQSGRPEHMIRTTNDVMRSLLFQASLSAYYWVERLHPATYLLNLLSTKVISAPSPHFTLFSTTSFYTHLWVFVCTSYPNTSTTTHHKLAPRSSRCVFLGYSSEHNGYWCLDLSTNCLLVSQNIIFDESSFSFASSDTPPIDFDSLFSSSHVVGLIAPPYPSSIVGTLEPNAATHAALAHRLTPHVAPVPPPMPYVSPVP